MTRCPIPATVRIPGWVLVLVGVTAWSVAAHGPAWSGTIKGTVRPTGPIVESRKLAVTADQYVCGKEKDSEAFAVRHLHRRQRPGVHHVVFADDPVQVEQNALS